MQLNYNSQNAQALGHCASFAFPPLVHTVSGLVHPLCPLGCFARVNVHGVLALLAADSAAPVEFALAFGDSPHAGGVIASAAAHDLASIGPTRDLVAHSSGCP